MLLVRRAAPIDLKDILALGEGVSPAIGDAIDHEHAFVAQADGEILAVAVAQPENGVHYVGSVVVREDMRHRGVGSRLMHGIREAVDTKLVVICTGQMSGFYHTLGYKPTGIVMESA